MNEKKRGWGYSSSPWHKPRARKSKHNKIGKKNWENAPDTFFSSSLFSREPNARTVFSFFFLFASQKKKRGRKRLRWELKEEANSLYGCAMVPCATYHLKSCSSLGHRETHTHTHTHAHAHAHAHAHVRCYDTRKTLSHLNKWKWTRKLKKGKREKARRVLSCMRALVY